jgi:hypothetical protein
VLQTARQGESNQQLNMGMKCACPLSHACNKAYRDRLISIGCGHTASRIPCLIIITTSGSGMQDVPQEAVETRGAAGAVPQPVKAPRKTVKQIREAKEEADRLRLLASQLVQRSSGGAAVMARTPERTAQAQR